jgi:amidase
MPDSTVSVAGLAAAVALGEVSALEIVRQRRATVEELSDLNALTATRWDAAERDAGEIDRRRAGGEALGPLAGIPFTVKDVIAVAGLPVTAASRAFATTVATTTAPAVQRLLDADAILLGKTNCPEFAFGTTCGNELFGETANPRYPQRSPGGSSGGEAAAVAAGISTIGVGTDYGGSLRWPAQCTGVVSLRATQGRIDPTGQVPGLGGAMGEGSIAWPSPTSLQGHVQVIGPLAGSVADLALALQVMQSQLRPVAVATGALRIGWCSGEAIGPVRREIAAATRSAATRLAAAGHQVVELTDAFEGCLQAFNELRAIDPMYDHLAAVQGFEGLVTAQNLATFRRSLGASPAELAAAWRAALQSRARALALFADVDVLLLPVAGATACWPDGTGDVDGVRVDVFDLMVHCRSVSLTGAPTVSVPVATAADGLPISLQVVAAPWREELALQIAAELEL